MHARIVAVGAFVAGLSPAFAQESPPGLPVAAPSSPFDRVVTVTLGEPIEVTVEFTGILFVRPEWQAGEPALVLRVGDASDDGEDGTRTPCLGVGVEAGRAVTIVADLAAHAGAAVSAADVHLIAGPETDATRAAATKADAALPEIAALRETGDVDDARQRIEAVIDELCGVPGSEHSELIACSLYACAEESHSLALLRPTRRAWSHILSHRMRVLPADHANLARARGTLAWTLVALGELHAARTLQELWLEVSTRARPADDPDVAFARLSLAATLCSLGDLHAARALQEQALETRSRTLAPDHLDLARARGNLATTLHALGDLHAARTLFEQALEGLTRALPPDDSEIAAARGNVAASLRAFGDLHAARALEEQVLEVRARTLPADHPHLAIARMNLALTLSSLGDLHAARALQQQVLDVSAARLPADHPHLATARSNMASTLVSLGDLGGAKVLQVQVLDVCTRTLPPDHPHLASARMHLAATLRSLGDTRAARSLEEQVLEVSARTLPPDHTALACARHELATTLAAMCGRTEVQAEAVGAFRRVVLAFVDGLLQRARGAALSASSRGSEESATEMQKHLGLALSYAAGFGVFEPDDALQQAAFSLSEATRGTGVVTARVARLTRGAPLAVNLWTDLRDARATVARLAQAGGASDALREAVARRDGVEQALLALAAETAGADLESLAAPNVAILSAGLGPHDALVAFRRYLRFRFEEDGVQSSDELCAFVVRAGGALSRSELGPTADVERAVEDWRAALMEPLARSKAAASDEDPGAVLRARGEALRRLVFDPVQPALGDVRRFTLVLDDILHAVPFDGLPLGEGLLGERYDADQRLTSWETTWPGLPPAAGSSLLALGGASFNSEPSLSEPGETEPQPQPQGTVGPSVAALLRGSPWEQGFEPLTYTGLEARGVAALFDEVSEEGARGLVLEKRTASRNALAARAPQARWLHIATHGWFAPESVKSWSDTPSPIDAQLGIVGQSAEERIAGASPMVLCGLALAGANLPPDELGRYPGLVTAEEIAGWDLSNCELAVLSACDTNVGIRRAGQGVASLQKALHMAGARSVITSLWKVPDEATKDLMLDFYRRLWVEKKPKRQALWEAKMRIRAAKDESGAPRYSTRDWAAWVLTGDPE